MRNVLRFAVAALGGAFTWWALSLVFLFVQLNLPLRGSGNDHFVLWILTYLMVTLSPAIIVFSQIWKRFKGQRK